MVTELRDSQVSLCHHCFQNTLYDKRCYASLRNSFFIKVNAMEYLRHMHAFQVLTQWIGTQSASHIFM